MQVLTFLLLNVLYLIVIVISKSYFCFCDNSRKDSFNIKDLPNVNTVLFDKQDCTKACWITAEVGLLINRYIFQLLLPMNPPNDMVAFFQDILWCFNKVNVIKSEKARRLIMDSLSDTIGGYLQSRGLPTAKEGYYEGFNNHQIISKYYDFQKSIKAILKTDGTGWAEPIKIKDPLKPVKKIFIPDLNARDGKPICDKIIFDTNDDVFPKLKKLLRLNNEKKIIIQLPFFDDCKHPHALAVPLKDRSLYSLYSNSSIGVLENYYVISINCISEKCIALQLSAIECKQNKKQFNREFSSWMRKFIIPRLHDTEWYPGFYESLRLFKTSFSVLNDSSKLVLTVVNKNTEKSPYYLYNYSFGTMITILSVLLLTVMTFYCCCKQTIQNYSESASCEDCSTCSHICDKNSPSEDGGSSETNQANNKCNDLQENKQQDCVVPTNIVQTKEDRISRFGENVESLPHGLQREDDDKTCTSTTARYLQTYFFEFERISPRDREISPDRNCNDSCYPHSTTPSSSNSSLPNYKSYREISSLTKEKG